ncbi:DUF2231 domain-containing protein [Gordonia zhaorongruii]|uniref:DUF2231 domain-containing protein n=1 Tax=Gordonia zhaorongruii TaxID=2597659 RepID=UPI00104A9137|nr:DUF2231 domain-containing protein [Gordonia zhaorongruii]
MDTLNGLPLHPLMVHFVVVAIPVAALVAIVAALWPRARTKLGIVTPVISLIALIATPIATTAGEGLEEHLPPTEALTTHTEAGDVVIIGIGCLFGATALLYLLGTRSVAARVPLPAVADVIARVLVVAAAIASLYLVFQAGDTGSHAVWDGIMG